MRLGQVAGSNNALYKTKQCLLVRSDAAQLKSDAGGSERLQGTAGAAFYARLASKLPGSLGKI